MAIYGLGFGQNRLLRDLPSEDRVGVDADGEEVELTLSQILAMPGEAIDHVYFPIRGFISIIAAVDGDRNLEVGLVGTDGMLGTSLALGVNVSPLKALVQGEGRALRLTTAAFTRLYSKSAELRTQVGRYLYVLTSQTARTAACTRFHLVEARLARWLLMTQDHAGSNKFRVTHAFLAWMLGVRREGVTEAASKLQRQHLISYNRGNVTILDTAALRHLACSCYAADKVAYLKLFPNGPAKRPRAKQATKPAR
ncbi:MAG: Crp/Fnr family transcriptional regulator [Casimicrobiaceae bacterium]